MISSSEHTHFEIFTMESAPEGSRDALTRLQQSIGLIPNLAATMAGSPALIQGFVDLREINGRESALSGQERELLLLCNALANDASYPQVFHSAMAAKAGLSPETIDAVRRESPLKDSRQGALVTFGRLVVKNRGKVQQADVQSFLRAGFQRRHILDVVACLAQSIMANYADNIASVEFDEFLKPKGQSSGV